MNEPAPLPSRGHAAMAIVLFGAAAVVSGAIALLDLFAGGPALAWAGAHLAAAFAVAPVVSRLADSRALLVAIRGAGAAGAVYLLIGGFVLPYGAFQVPLALAVAAASAFAAAVRARRRVAGGVLGAAAVVLGAAAWRALAAPAALLPAEPWRAHAVLAACGVTLVATAAGREFLRRRDIRHGAGLARLVTESELRNLLVVLPVALVAFYRQPMEDVLPHMQIYEWVLGLAIAFYAVAALRARYRDAAVDAPWRSESAAHVVHVEARPDAAFDAARAAFRFVDTGDGREGYARFWRETGGRAGVPLAIIDDLLAGLDEEGGDRATRRRRGGTSREDARAIRESVHRALLARVLDGAVKVKGVDHGGQERARGV